MPITSHIIATGSYLPKRVVNNNELAKLMTTSDAWIKEKIGVHERRFAKPGEGVSDMACAAANAALKEAGLSAKDLDAIVFATATPEFHAPGSGILLQNKLGCREIPAFDVRNTSPGFLFALDLADGLLKSGRYETVLVVGSEVHSTGLDFSDRGRAMAVIFGDGAGCVILSSKRRGLAIKDFVLHSNGKDFDKLWCEGPSSLKSPRVTPDQIAADIFFPHMDGPVVFENAVEKMTAVIKELLIKNKMGVGDIDWILSHQANARIIRAVAKNLNFDEAKAPIILDKYGNTSSASIPILLDELRTDGKIKSGEHLVMVSFGSGFCWGAGLLES